MVNRKSVTLKDVAKALDLSVISVSKCLSNAPDMAAVTKDRVKKTAKKMGYRPNLAARRLQSLRIHPGGLRRRRKD